MDSRVQLICMLLNNCHTASLFGVHDGEKF